MEIRYFIERKEYLEKAIAKLNKTICSYPPGELAIYEQNGYRKWMILGADNTDKKQYIKKSDRKLAELMARKKFVRFKLDALKNELDCVSAYINNRTEPDWDKFWGDGSFYRELLQRNDDWEYEPYKVYEEFPECKNVDAPKGEKVRSKSEAMIAFCLYENGIPYHYEECYDFDGIVYAPDFTIKHPKTGKVYIWEHFGLIDQRKYQAKMFDKLPVYISHGIVPDKNLIMTFETEAEALSIMKVSRIVQEIFME